MKKLKILYESSHLNWFEQFWKISANKNKHLNKPQYSYLLLESSNINIYRLEIFK